MKTKKQHWLKNADPVVELIEWFDAHWYKIEFPEKKEVHHVASVTTKLGALPNQWLIRHYGDLGTREALRRLEAAGDFGSRVHHAVYQFVTGGAVVYQPPWNKRQVYSSEQMAKLSEKYEGRLAVLQDQQEMLHVARFERMFRDVQPQILGSESIVYSLPSSFNTAGTVDHIWWLEKDRMLKTFGFPLSKGIWIQDLKTGAESASHRMQVAAYVRLYEEMTGEKVAGGLIYYSKTNKLVIIQRKEIDLEFEDFLHVAHIWDRLNPKASPEVLDFPSLISLT